MRLILLAYSILLLALPPALAADATSGPTAAPAPLPKFEALRFAKVNMHAGPGMQYPIVWTYQRKNLPVRVLASYDVWKQVADPDGTTGWVEDTMLTDKRTALVAKARRTLRHDPQDTAPAVALADPGAVAKIAACTGGWCDLKFDDYEGWLRTSELWGIDPNETFEVKR